MEFLEEHWQELMLLHQLCLEGLGILHPSHMRLESA